MSLILNFTNVLNENRTCFKRYFEIKALVLLILVSGCNSVNEKGISKEEASAVTDLRIQFENSWLLGDSAKVLSYLTEDAVLMPHHGDDPIKGIKNISEFWFPFGVPPTKILEFSSSENEVVGNGYYASIQGRFKLAFEYDGKTYTNEGNYLNTATKKEGKWKLTRLIWNDPIPRNN